MVLLSVLSPCPARGEPPEAEIQTSETSDAKRLVDMVVAEVNATTITFSELYAETQLVLLRTGGPTIVNAAQISQDLLDAVLRSIITRRLLILEVQRLKLRDLPDSEVEKHVEAVRQLFPSRGDYHAFLIKSGFGDESELETGTLDAPPSLVAVLRAEAQVEDFLEVRIRRAIRVSNEEVLRCFELKKEAWSGQTFDAVSTRIKSRMADDRRDLAVQQLVERLDARSDIRLTPGFGAKAQPALVPLCPIEEGS